MTINKYILLILTITSPFYSIAQSAKSSNTGDFGRYGDCSTGRGICGVGTDNIATNGKSNFSIEKKNDSIIILKLYKANISNAKEAAVYGKALQDFAASEKIYFKMDIDLLLDANTKSSLRIGNNYFKIPAGNYLLTSNTDYYFTEIKLQ